MAKSQPSDPVAALSVPETAKVGEVVMVDASASHDPGGFIQSAQLNFGDGITVRFPAKKLQPHPHVWYVPGDYTVTLSVVDNTKHSASASATITVAEVVEPAPEPEPEPEPVPEPEPEPEPVPEPEPNPIPVPPPSGDAHAYFDALTKRPEHLYSRSLRDPNQYPQLVPGGRIVTYSYDPANDTNPNAQDAMKVVMQVNPDTLGVSVPDPMFFPAYGQSWKPDDTGPGHAVLFTWDWMWLPETLKNHGGVTHMKSFQVMAGHNSGWWTLVHAWASSVLRERRPDAIATVTNEFRAGGKPAGMLRHERVSPSGPGTEPFTEYPSYNDAYPMPSARWTRFWVEIRSAQPPSAFTEWNAAYGVTVGLNALDAEGRWHMISMWAADEGRDAHRILYKVPMAWNVYASHIGAFRLELNSSKKGATGPLLAYGRNFAVLKDYTLPDVPETDRFIFQRPVR